MKINKLSFVFAIFTALTFISTSIVFAGSKSTQNVSVGASTFGGSLGSARNSADNLQQIGCYFDSAGTGNCYGRDSVGTTKACSTNAAALLTVIRSIKGDSYMLVRFTGGTCTSIRVSNFSSFKPKIN